MFDAKSLLESLMRGGEPARPQAAAGGLGDLLSQLGKAMGQGGSSGGKGEIGRAHV